MAEYEEDDGFDREAAEAMAELERDDGSDTEAARAMAELERRGAPRLAPSQRLAHSRRRAGRVPVWTAEQRRCSPSSTPHSASTCATTARGASRWARDCGPATTLGHSDSLTAPPVVSERWRQVPAAEQDDG